MFLISWKVLEVERGPVQTRIHFGHFKDHTLLNLTQRTLPSDIVNLGPEEYFEVEGMEVELGKVGNKSEGLPILTICSELGVLM
jgi:hypothetical protein